MSNVTQALADVAGQSIHNEALSAAGSAIAVGHFVEELNAGTVQEQSGAGAFAQTLIALTNPIVGGTINDVYGVGVTVRYGAFHSGQRVFVKLAAAAAAVVKGAALELAGDGTMRVLAAGEIKAYAVEAVDNSGGGAEVFLEVRIA